MTGTIKTIGICTAYAMERMAKMHMLVMVRSNLWLCRGGGKNMRPFCSNNQCIHHKTMVAQDRYSIEVEDHLGRRKIDRHLYVDAGGNNLELCSICHNAVDLIRRKR